MNTYKHSVYHDISKCTGCTTCLRHCPTEAIRIKNGRAIINEDRCIDCGECIRVCHSKAAKTVHTDLGRLNDFKWKIALPAPTLYGQFDNLDDVDYVLDGLLRVGFDDVFEVSAAAELVSAYTRLYLKDKRVKKPVISSACPVIVRLIGLRFPSLGEHIMHMLPPMEIAAHMARRAAKEKHPELDDGDIGIFFISPCPAKVSYVNNGFADYKSAVDCVIPISDIYFRLIAAMRHDVSADTLSHSGMIGIGWAVTGGESTAVFNDNYLAADGIDNCIHVLDQIENGTMPSLEFIELNACAGGCVGGVCTIQNPFIAKARLQGLRRYLPVSCNFLKDGEGTVPEDCMFSDLPSYRPISVFSDNFVESMRMMSEIQRIRDTLPGIDCGSCGAPTCRAFAEDIVRGSGTARECPIQRYRNEFGSQEQGGDTDDGE